MIGLRNLITHAYDIIEEELILGILQKDIPKLSEEFNSLRIKG
ncbi:MAG: DUF86 domain-containing protein [Flavobacteriales bacterium]|nr:DUF86 domain-containing protein [Flavobacteriales bacterium]